jgi:hypothetical protein
MCFKEKMISIKSISAGILTSRGGGGAKDARCKKLVVILAALIALACGVIMIPPVASVIIRSAESIKTFSNTTWQMIIYSYTTAAIIVSVIIIYSIVSKKISDRLRNILYFGFISALLLFITIIVYKYGNNWINSDHSGEIMLGKLLAEENELVTAKWYYPTELRLVYQQLFMVPLFKIFDNWRLVRALTVPLNLVVLLVSYVFMMTRIKITSKWIMFTSLFLVIPINFDYWDTVVFGGYYVFFLALFFCFLGLFFILADGEKPESKSRKTVFALFCVLSIIHGTGGVRALMDIQIPLLLTCLFIYHFAYRFNRVKIKHTVNLAFNLALISLLLCGFGYFLNFIFHFFFKFHSFHGLSTADLNGGFFKKLGDILLNFIVFTGYTANSKIFSPDGIFSLLAVLLSIFIIVLPIKIISKYIKKNINNDALFSPKIFMLLFFIVSAIYHIFLFFFFDQEITTRYFIPFLIFYIPLIAILFDRIRDFFSYRNASLLVMLTAMILFGNSATKFQQIIRTDINSIRHGYINYLMRHNLHFGFATFWNSNVTTELTNGTVEIMGLSSDPQPVKYDWLRPVKYDDPLYYTGETFLLLSREEWSELKNTGKFTGKQPVYEDDHFIILTYPSAQFIHKELLQ